MYLFMYYVYVVTVKREMLVAIIFGGFENITIWLGFNLAISLKESGWGPYFFQLVTTNFGQIYYFAKNLVKKLVMRSKSVSGCQKMCHVVKTFHGVKIFIMASLSTTYVMKSNSLSHQKFVINTP